MKYPAWVLAPAALLLVGSPAAAADADPLKTATSIPEQLIVSLTTLVTFVVLLWLLSKTAWGPIVRGLRAREERIANDLRAAEENRRKSEALLREYDAKIAAAEAEIRKMMAQATADAEKIRVTLQARAQQEIEEMREKASREIDAEKTRAIAELQEQAAELATLVAEKILRRQITPEDQRELVRASLEQLAQSRNN